MDETNTLIAPKGEKIGCSGNIFDVKTSKKIELLGNQFNDIDRVCREDETKLKVFSSVLLNLDLLNPEIEKKDFSPTWKKRHPCFDSNYLAIDSTRIWFASTDSFRHGVTLVNNETEEKFYRNWGGISRAEFIEISDSANQFSLEVGKYLIGEVGI